MDLRNFCCCPNVLRPRYYSYVLDWAAKTVSATNVFCEGKVPEAAVQDMSWSGSDETQQTEAPVDGRWDSLGIEF